MKFNQIDSFSKKIRIQIPQLHLNSVEMSEYGQEDIVVHKKNINKKFEFN